MFWIKIVIANLAFLIFYILIMIALKKYIISRYEKSEEKEKEATRLNTFLIRAIFIISLAMGAIGGFSVGILNSKTHNYLADFFILLIYVLEIFIVAVFVTTTVQARILNQKVKGLFLVRQFVSGLLGCVVMLGIIFLPIVKSLRSDNIKYIYFLPVAFFIGNYLFYIIFLNLQYPKRRLNEGEEKIIKNTLKRFGIESLRVTVLDTLGQKFANLFAAGIFKPQLLVTSYALENLREDELDAVLVHEIGHIKTKHVQKILFGWLIAILYYLALVFGLESLAGYFVSESKMLNFIRLAILLIGAIQFLFLPSYISRTAEIEADLFVLKSGVKKEVYENALKTLYAINYIKGDVSNALEKIQSHPSLKNRIKILAEAENKVEKGDTHKFKKIYICLATACAIFATVYLAFGLFLPQEDVKSWSQNIEKIKIEKNIPTLIEIAGSKKEIDLPAKVDITDKKDIETIVKSINKTRKKFSLANTVLNNDYHIEIFEKNGKSHLYSYSSDSGTLIKYVPAVDFNKDKPWWGVNKEIGKIILKYSYGFSNLGSGQESVSSSVYKWFVCVDKDWPKYDNSAAVLIEKEKDKNIGICALKYEIKLPPWVNRKDIGDAIKEAFSVYLRKAKLYSIAPLSEKIFVDYKIVFKEYEKNKVMAGVVYSFAGFSFVNSEFAAEALGGLEVAKGEILLNSDGSIKSIFLTIPTGQGKYFSKSIERIFGSEKTKKLLLNYQFSKRIYDYAKEYLKSIGKENVKIARYVQTKPANNWYSQQVYNLLPKVSGITGWNFIESGSIRRLYMIYNFQTPIECTHKTVFEKFNENEALISFYNIWDVKINGKPIQSYWKFRLNMDGTYKLVDKNDQTGLLLEIVRRIEKKSES